MSTNDPHPIDPDVDDAGTAPVAEDGTTPTEDAALDPAPETARVTRDVEGGGEAAAAAPGEAGQAAMAPSGEPLEAAGATTGAVPPGSTVEYTRVDIPKAPVALAVLALLAALAGLVYYIIVGPSYDAYTVDGTTVSREGLVEEIGAIAPDLVEVAQDPESAPPEQRAQLAQTMTGLIAEDLFEQAAEEAGVQVDSQAVDDELAEILENQFGGDADAFDQAIAQSGLSEEGVRQQVRTSLLLEGVAEASGAGEEVTDEQVQEVYDTQFGAPTVSHILVETEEEAQQAIDRIESGEDFATVASEMSIDGSAAQGGQLGPFQEGAFVPEFEEAVLETEPGEITGPVQTEFGYHVITVEAPPGIEEVRADIVEVLEGQNRNTAVQGLLAEIDEQAEVEVDPVYGEWVGLLQGGVRPPETATPELPLGPGPEGGAAAPEGEAPAPEGEAPAPEGEAPAPEGEAAAPEGEAAAPEGEAPTEQ